MSLRDWLPLGRKAARTPPARQASLLEQQLLGAYQYRDAPKRNAEDLVKAYASLPWLRALVDKTSRATATIPWTLSVPTNSAGKAMRNRSLQGGDRASRKQLAALLTKQARLREIETHPLLDCLDGGNPLLIGLNVRRITQIHLDLVGEAFWLLERNGAGMPIAIWPIPPHAIRRTPTPAYPFFDVNYRTAQLLGVPATEILHFLEPDPWDPYGRGTGIGGALADELEGGEYAAKAIKTFFFNDARPPILVTPKADAGMEVHEAQRLEAKWTEKVAGFLNRYRPMFLTRPVDVKELQTKFDDMQLVELLRYFRDTERQVYGMPPELLGILDQSNRATIDASELLFARWLVLPRIEAQRAHLQERFLPQFDERLVLGYVSPVPEDHAFSLSVMQARPQAFSADDWRAKAGFDELPQEQGKLYVIGFGDRAVRTLDELLDGAPLAGEPRVPAEGTPSPVDAGPVAADATTKRLRLVPKAIRRDDLEAILGALDPQALDRVMMPVLQQTVRAFAEETLTAASAQVSFDLGNPRMAAYLREESATKIKGLIDATTRDALRASLADGIEAGETTADLAARITDVFAEAEGPRAFTIARTETTGAANAGAEEGIRQAGFDAKEWVSALAETTRDTHRAMHHQIRNIDEKFDSPSGAQADYPGDFGVADEDINCLCFVAASEGVKAMKAYGDAAHVLQCKANEVRRAVHERTLRAAVQRGFRAQQRTVTAKLMQLALAVPAAA